MTRRPNEAKEIWDLVEHYLLGSEELSPYWDTLHLTQQRKLKNDLLEVIEGVLEQSRADVRNALEYELDRAIDRAF